MHKRISAYPQNHGTRHSRFFLADLAAVARDDVCVQLDAPQSHHLVRVVRLSEGTAIWAEG